MSPDRILTATNLDIHALRVRLGNLSDRAAFTLRRNPCAYESLSSYSSPWPLRRPCSEPTFGGVGRRKRPEPVHGGVAVQIVLRGHRRHRGGRGGHRPGLRGLWAVQCHRHVHRERGARSARRDHHLVRHRNHGECCSNGSGDHPQSRADRCRRKCRHSAGAGGRASRAELPDPRIYQRRDRREQGAAVGRSLGDSRLRLRRGGDLRGQQWNGRRGRQPSATR